MSKYWLIYRGAQATNLGKSLAWLVAVLSALLFWAFIILMAVCLGASAPPEAEVIAKAEHYDKPI